MNADRDPVAACGYEVGGWRWWTLRLALLALYIGGIVAIGLRGGWQ